jgi:hypothetical protein
MTRAGCSGACGGGAAAGWESGGAKGLKRPGTASLKVNGKGMSLLTACRSGSTSPPQAPDAHPDNVIAGASLAFLGFPPYPHGSFINLYLQY